MSELKGACIVGQSGGPTSVINASVYGVIDTALKNPNITRVLGAEHGIKGVLNDRLFDMAEEDPAELELLKYTPSSALGSFISFWAVLPVALVVSKLSEEVKTPFSLLFFLQLVYFVYYFRPYLHLLKIICKICIIFPIGNFSKIIFF